MSRQPHAGRRRTRQTVPSNGRSLRQEAHQQTPVLQALHGARDGFAAVADAHGKLFTAKEFRLVNQVFLFGKHVSGFQLLRIAQHHGVLLRIDFQHVGRFAQSNLQPLPLPDGVVKGILCARPA